MNVLRGTIAVLLLLSLPLLSGCTLLAPDAATTPTPTPMSTATPTPTTAPSATGPVTTAPSATEPVTTAPSATEPTTADTPTDPDAPASRTVSIAIRTANDTSAPYTYVAWFVDDPLERVTIGYADGSERTVAIEDNRLPEGVLDGAVTLTPAALHRA